MFQIPNFYLFLAVSLLINLSPGPDMIYTIARSLSQGTRAGILSALGIGAGCLFHISAAVFGLSKIIEESVLLFSIIKYAGAAYLIYLGVRSIMNKGSKTEDKALPPKSGRRIFFQGTLTNMLNPKVAIFFLSFLPQFIDPKSVFLKEQIAFLGFWFDAQGALVLIFVAIVAGYFKRILQENGRFWSGQQKLTGTILLVLGVKMIFSKK